MSAWVLLDTIPTAVNIPAIPKEPEWVQLGTALSISVAIPEVVKEWVELHQIGVMVNPLTPVSEWKLLQTMTVAISVPGEPAPPVPVPPTPPEEEKGKVNWWLWGGLAAIAIVIVVIMLTRRGTAGGGE